MIGSNPFCTRFVRPGAIPYRFVGSHGDLNSICDRLQSSRNGLIIGPHGSGKSTLLQSLMPFLQQRFGRIGHLQLSANPLVTPLGRMLQKRQSWILVRDHWASLNDNDLVIIDGLEQTFAHDRIRMLCRPKNRRPAILGTSHSRLFGLPVLFQTRTSRELIVQLTERLIHNQPDLVAGLVHHKLANHDWDRPVNLRDFWFECYDDIQCYHRQTLASQETLT